MFDLIRKLPHGAKNVSLIVIFLFVVEFDVVNLIDFSFHKRQHYY